MTFVLRASLASALVALAAMACSAKGSSGAATDHVCTAGNYVYCRCQDRSEGTKLCHDDGKGFDPCTCETPGNPEVPPDPPTSPPGGDGGGDVVVTPPSGPAQCGNGIPETNEACDDANSDPTDGCDLCQLSGTDPPASKSCPGMEVHVWPGHPVTYTGTTIDGSYFAAASPTCPSAGGNYPTTGAAAHERLFHVTAHATGSLTITTSDTDFDDFLYAGSTCVAGDEAYLSCANKVTGAGGETLTLPVDAGKSYTVFVDGAGISGNEGVFRVTFTLP